MPTTELEPITAPLEIDSALPFPLALQEVTAKLAGRVPRWVSRHAEGIIAATSQVTAIKDDDTRSIVKAYAANLQAEKALMLKHYKPFKDAFHGPHKIVCAMEKDGLEPIDREIGRLKDLLSDIAEPTELSFITNENTLGEIVKAAAKNPRLIKFLQLNMRAIGEQLKQDGIHLNIPGVEVANTAKRPVIRGEAL